MGHRCMCEYKFVEPKFSEGFENTLIGFHTFESRQLERDMELLEEFEMSRGDELLDPRDVIKLLSAQERVTRDDMKAESTDLYRIPDEQMSELFAYIDASNKFHARPCQMFGDRLYELRKKYLLNQTND